MTFYFFNQLINFIWANLYIFVNQVADHSWLKMKNHGGNQLMSNKIKRKAYVNLLPTISLPNHLVHKTTFIMLILFIRGESCVKCVIGLVQAPDGSHDVRELECKWHWPLHCCLLRSYISIKFSAEKVNWIDCTLNVSNCNLILLPWEVAF